MLLENAKMMETSGRDGTELMDSGREDTLELKTEEMSRGLRRMITREQNGVAGLLRELRNGIKAEIEGSQQTTLEHAFGE